MFSSSYIPSAFLSALPCLSLAHMPAHYSTAWSAPVEPEYVPATQEVHDDAPANWYQTPAVPLAVALKGAAVSINDAVALFVEVLLDAKVLESL